MSDAECISSCWVAAGKTSQIDAPCQIASCKPTYGRCACNGAAVLRIDGGCEGDRAPNQSACVALRSATIVVAGLIVSPEVQVVDVQSGVVSAAIVTVLRRGVAAILGVVPSLVSLVDARFERAQVLQATNSSKISVITDITFSFCTSGIARSVQGNIDNLFTVEAQRFVVFSASTLRVLAFSAQESVTLAPSESQDTSTNAPIQPPRESTSENDDGLPAWVIAALFGYVPVFLVLICLALILTMRRKYEERVEACAALDPLPVNVPDGPLPDSLPWVVAIQAFRLEDVEEESRRPDCLALTPGDMMEVVVGRAGDAWIYGRRATGSYEADGIEMGFFPEVCIAWVGKPISDAQPSPLVLGRIENEVGVGTPETCALTKAEGAELSLRIAASASEVPPAPELVPGSVPA